MHEGGEVQRTGKMPAWKSSLRHSLFLLMLIIGLGWFGTRVFLRAGIQMSSADPVEETGIPEHEWMTDVLRQYLRNARSPDLLVRGRAVWGVMCFLRKEKPKLTRSEIEMWIGPGEDRIVGKNVLVSLHTNVYLPHPEKADFYLGPYLMSILYEWQQGDYYLERVDGPFF